MSKKRDEELEALDRQIEEMKAAGNREGEAALQARKALVLALSGDLQAAVDAVARTGVLAEEEGQYAQLAQAHLATGKALKAYPARRKEARKSLRKAVALYRTLEDPRGEAEAHQELAAMAIAAGDFDQALDTLEKAFSALPEAGFDEQKATLYRLSANCRLVQGQTEQAVADVQTALNLAEESGEEDLALQLRMELHTLQPLVAGDDVAKNMDELLRAAQQAGNVQVLGDLRLQQAAASIYSGQFERGLAQAKAARRAARDARDMPRFVRYLLATLLMAEASERLDDRPGVLAALLTCKVYLEAHLGADVGQQMNGILDGLEQRWGQGGMAEAVRAYQERVEKEGPYQA